MIANHLEERSVPAVEPVAPAPDSAPIRVILADDHPIGRQGVRYYLEETGRFTIVAEAGDGLQAIRLIERHRPDVAVLDLHMPGCNGIEVARRVVERKCATRLLILSAYDDAHLVQSALEAGASGYLLKSADPDLIIESVEAVYRGETILDPALLIKLQAGGAGASLISPLTERELEVLHEVLNGLQDKAIARRLGITDSTVALHLNKVFRKLGVHKRTQAVARALALGLTRTPPPSG